MTRQGKKKKRVDNDKLNHMLVDVFTLLDEVKAKPSMWADERLQPLCDWHGYISSHPDLFPPVGPHDDVPMALALEEMALALEESNLIKGIVSRLWDRDPIDFPQEQPCVLVHTFVTYVTMACMCFFLFTNLSSLSLQR
jgi:hypothetical protein